MAAFKTLDEIGDIRGKRVLVRVDLNVPTSDGKVTDATRIERVKPINSFVNFHSRNGGSNRGGFGPLRTMPIGRRYPLSALKAALLRFPLRPRERITIEYVLLSGVNDGDEDAVRLSDFCRDFPHNINLIPFNEHHLSPFRAPSEGRVDGFARALLGQKQTLVTVRRSRGRDVQAACGQLVQS